MTVARWGGALAGLALLGWANVAGAAKVDLGKAQVTFEGIGPVRFGMSLDEAEEALAMPLETQGGGEESTDCDIVVPKRGPAGLSFMASSDTIVRLDVGKPGVRTSSGIGVGSREDEVLAAYGKRLWVDPHPVRAAEGWHLMQIFSPDDRAKIVFETNGKRVVRYRAGLYPDVDFAEGCS